MCLPTMLFDVFDNRGLECLQFTLGQRVRFGNDRDDIDFVVKSLDGLDIKWFHP